MALTPEHVEQLRMLVRTACGVVVPDEKPSVLETRLGSVARREEFGSVEALMEALKPPRDQALVRSIVDALSNGETRFFRDKIPFEQLRREVVPALHRARGGQPLRVWSAGCSTGQEAYSLAMLMDSAAEDVPGARLDIIATDVSERRLEKAQAGLYTGFEVQRGLPVRELVKHFEKVDDNWRVGPRLRQAIRWGRFNLMHDPKPLGRFDVILCRNVLSEFDEDTRAATLKRLAGALADDGLLFLGLNETTHGLTELFRPVPGRRGLYCKNPTHLRRVA